ncbi:MAG: DNA gyrase inhibitor YacG [Psychrobium sp.]|nr:DNA gyrase inhibitor YacG [Psychrobium sp.]
MTVVDCPTCQKKVTWNKESIYRPFCCERCKLIDLGEWASEGHTIAGTQLSENMPFDEFDLPINDDFFNKQ